MSRTDKLERQIRETRSQLSATLEELTYRAKPKRVLSQTTDGLKHSTAARFFTNLETDVMSNPVPLTLLAAGLSWLIFRPGRRNQSPGDNVYALAFRRLAQMRKVAGQNASRTVSTVHRRATDAQQRAASLARRASQTASTVTEAAQNTATVTKDVLTSTVQTAQSGVEAVRGSGTALASGVSKGASAVEKHPALLAGTALAIGGAAALAFFFGRTLRDELAIQSDPGDAPPPISPERALALVDESALSLVPTGTGA
jgi:uncharacterized phage infection (PIP) family protein YhgE